MIKKSRKTLQGFLAAVLIAAGVFAPERGVRAEEKAMDVKTDVRELSRQEVSLIAYEIPIEKLHTDITEQTETEAEPQTETTDQTESAEQAETAAPAETADQSEGMDQAEITDEVRIGAKTSDMTGVHGSIFRYAYTSMLAAMLALTVWLRILKKEKEGE